MRFDLNLICIVLFYFIWVCCSYFLHLLLFGFFFFFSLYGWMSHNGSPKVKMGVVELGAVEHGHRQ